MCPVFFLSVPPLSAMNIRLLLDLVRYHYQKNDIEFERTANEIADVFRRVGKYEVADYIRAQMSSQQSVSPQSLEKREGERCTSEQPATSSPQLSNLFVEVPTTANPLPMPLQLVESLQGISLAIDKRKMLSKFLFVGKPGTGKTEAVKQISFQLNRKLYSVNFSQLIDSRLGQTAKNIENLFAEISNSSYPETRIYLFDEIDGLALTRTDDNDIREMGRATTAFIRGMDRLHPGVIIFATTNLGDKIDDALLRRFDYVLNFDCYTKEDLVRSALCILSSFLGNAEKNEIVLRIAEKIFNLAELEAPGVLRNKIRTAVAFSDPEKKFSYLSILYKELVDKDLDITILHKQGFTLREIELLTGKSKSQVSRLLVRELYESSN